MKPGGLKGRENRLLVHKGVWEHSDFFFLVTFKTNGSELVDKPSQDSKPGGLTGVF